MKNHGFSLVELSIVLVILGLLTGGILAGQNLIRASELRAVSTQVQSFQAAINTFRDKYFALPGDMRNATDFWGIAAGTAGNDATCRAAGTTDGSTCDGDGNGLIGVSDGEHFRFWQHLANAGLIEGSFTGVAGSIGIYDVDARVNAPPARLANATWGTRTLTLTSQPAGGRYNGTYSNHFQLGISNTSSGWVDDPILATEELWNIDTKMDDGLPGSGGIISISNCSVAADPDDRSSPYDLSDPGPCYAHFLWSGRLGQ